MKTLEQEIAYIEKFTEVYRQHLNAPKAIREAHCLGVQYPYMLADIEPGDVLAGRFRYPVIYFVPQTYSGKGGIGYGYVFDELCYDALMAMPDITTQQVSRLKAIELFWKDENTAGKCRPLYTPEINEALPEDNWVVESGVAFPLYRMAGSQLDYDTLLQLGIPGLRSLVEAKIVQMDDSERFYESCLLALDTLANSCLYYSGMARYFASESADAARAKHLTDLSLALTHIAGNKPDSLMGAIQLYFLYNTLAGSMNFGRIDEALGDFLVADLNSGKLTHHEAQALVTGLWRLMASRKTISMADP